MTAPVDLPPSPPIIPGLQAWFQSVNPGAQPLYANRGVLQAPVYWEYIGSPAIHTPALDAEASELHAYIMADETFAMNSNIGQTTFGNNGPVGVASTTPSTASTSLTAPLTAATPAIQQAIIGIAQQAVQLPSDHSAHSWLSSFFGAVASLLIPIVQQVAVSEVSNLVQRIPGAKPPTA